MKYGHKVLLRKDDEPKMDIGPIKAALGEDMPEIEPTALGRYRLVQALRFKHGDNYRNIKSAKSALDHFDKEHKWFKSYRKLKGV